MRPLFAVLALALPALVLAQGPPQSPAFTEEMEVREIGLLVEAPQSLLKQITADPEDVLISVDGVLRPATRMIDEAAADWNVAIYVDNVLAPPETVFYATLALARRSERLARLGAVEVMVADPGPRLELAPNREAPRLHQALSDLAGRARIRRDGTETIRSDPDAATLRRQCDRLIAWASAPRPPGPRVLFLVADGFAITPEEQKALEADGEVAATGRPAILHETARMLAAYGWITIPLPLRERREAEAMEPARPDSDLDRFRMGSGGGTLSNGIPPVTQFPKRAPSPFRWEAAITLQIEPDLSPLRALVSSTAGKLVGLDALLDPALDNLTGRWQLWFQAREPNEGRARPVEVRLRDGTPLRTRAWLRSSTPEEAASARVRALLLSATGRQEGTLPLQIDPKADPGRLVLRLTVAPFEDAGPVAPGPVRISWAFADEQGPQVHHEMAPGIRKPGQGWSHTLTIPIPPGAGRLAVAVDDLARERWSGTVLNLTE